MGRPHNFPLPEMPGVCLACGARGPLTPAKFVYKHTSKASAVMTALALCAGVVYTRQMVYRLELPVCDFCLSDVRRAKRVAVAGVALVFAAAFVSGWFSNVHELFYLTFFLYAVGALAYCLFVHKRGRPKASRVDDDHLILSVPDYGQFVVYDRAAAAEAAA
ncbi:MAG TPA: hypothetical protein VM936_09225 [Pyrinomonadaceae bacterium]|nr:hypothetical protein [Pyrinomonadaceae bacterium]